MSFQTSKNYILMDKEETNKLYQNGKRKNCHKR